MLSTILKRSQTNNYIIQLKYKKYLLERFNINLTLKNISADIPQSLPVDGATISKLVAISYIFQNYLSSPATRNKLNISFSQRHFSDFPKNGSNISFL